MQEYELTTKALVELRIDHGLNDLEIAKEQLIRHSAELPKSFDYAYILEHLTTAINSLRDLYI